MKKLTTHEAVLKALNTKWMTGAEIRKFVHTKTGRWISESNVTARIRECRPAHPVTCRYLDQHNGRRRWEYGIAE